MMADPTITNVDRGSVVINSDLFVDDLLTFTGADVYVEGTILARDSVSKKLIAFVKGGSTNEDGIPKTVLTYGVTATGAGDIPIRRSTGMSVRKERLVIDADGDDSNVDMVVRDQLQDYNIEVVDSPDESVLDNQ